MRHELTVDREQGCAFIRVTAPATVESLLALVEEVVAHADWVPGLKILADFRGSDVSALSGLEIRSVSGAVLELGEEFGNGRVAAVVATDVDYGMARMWELVTADRTPFEFRIFRDIAQAADWLGVVPPA